MKATFYSTNILYKYVCVFAYKQIHQQKGLNIEYLYDQSLPTWDYIETKDLKKIKVITLGVGKYSFIYKDAVIDIHIDRFINPPITNKHGEPVYQVDLYLDDEKYDSNILFEYVNEARCKIDDEMNQLGKDINTTIRKYIYEIAGGYGEWTILNVGKKRKMDSLFLPEKERMDLVTTVQHFVKEDTKIEYEKYGIPYKCNILLHGTPGSGKTTTIHCIASMINSDIGIIQLTRSIDDIHLTKAVNSMTRLDNCKVLVLEDIDSIFSDNRKAHDSTKNSVTLSGILNFLDGLMRNEGIIVFITTNTKEVLDEAIFRSGRIDYQLEYGYCKEEQVINMIQFYYPNNKELAENFYTRIQSYQYTVSDLQHYLFKYRRNPSEIIKNYKELIKKESTEGNKSLYT